MARSQAIAAYACGIEPHTDMNPVLLKPTDTLDSEVVLNGKSIGYLKGFEYDKLKKALSDESYEEYQNQQFDDLSNAKGGYLLTIDKNFILPVTTYVQGLSNLM